MRPGTATRARHARPRIERHKGRFALAGSDRGTFPAGDVVCNQIARESVHGPGTHTTRNPWSSDLTDGEFLPRLAERKAKG